MLTPEQTEKVKKHLDTAKNIALTTIKYGVVFTSGVLVGAICGVVLFFKIGNDPLNR